MGPARIRGACNLLLNTPFRCSDEAITNVGLAEMWAWQWITNVGLAEILGLDRLNQQVAGQA
jgi:hypothetical protein